MVMTRYRKTKIIGKTVSDVMRVINSLIESEKREGAEWQGNPLGAMPTKSQSKS